MTAAGTEDGKRGGPAVGTRGRVLAALAALLVVAAGVVVLIGSSGSRTAEVVAGGGSSLPSAEVGERTTTGDLERATRPQPGDRMGSASSPPAPAPPSNPGVRCEAPDVSLSASATTIEVGETVAFVLEVDDTPGSCEIATVAWSTKGPQVRDLTGGTALELGFALEGDHHIVATPVYRLDAEGRVAALAPKRVTVAVEPARGSLDDVDWADMGYARPCGEDLFGPEVAELTDGRAEGTAGPGFLVELREVQVTDLDGAPGQEAAVLLACQSGVTGKASSLFVFEPGPDGPVLRSTSATILNGFFAFEGGAIVSYQGDGICCPSAFDRLVWQVDGAGVHPDGLQSRILGRNLLLT